MKKKTILSSLLTIILCLSLIAGSTYALFTSEDHVNIAVTSGKVNVVATILDEAMKTYSLGQEQPTGTFENGGTAVFTTESGEKVLTLDRMTPGDKVNFTIELTNNSSVALQYRLSWAVNGVLYEYLVAKANDVEIVNNVSNWIEWNTPVAQDGSDKVRTVNVSIELPETVGNEANADNMTASITFAIEAVQANGTHLIPNKVSSADDLAIALDSDAPIALMCDVDNFGKTLNNNVTLDLEGHTFDSKGFTAKAGLTMSDGKYDMDAFSNYIDVRPAEDNMVYNFSDVNFVNNYKTRTSNNGSTDRVEYALKYTAVVDGTKATFVFENCVFDNANFAFAGLSSASGEIDVTFKNCTFNALTNSGKLIEIGNYVSGTVTIENCTFNMDCTKNSLSVLYVSNSSSTHITVNASNNTLNANKATAYTHNAEQGETNVDDVKIDYYGVSRIYFFDFRQLPGGYSTVNETGTILQGDVAVESLR